MTNVTIGAVLLAGTTTFGVFLLAVEAYCVVNGLPTISERIQDLARSAPLVIVVVCTVTGIALDHFFGHITFGEVRAKLRQRG